MAERDAAFMWESEVLRASQQRAATGPEPAHDGGWMTLREAHRATGIPVETLRKWARRKSIPSHLDETEFGTRRLVEIDAVERRAEALGRPIAPLPEPAAPEPASGDKPPPEQPQPQAPATEAPPPETMIVPIAAWDKMLMQLGNLHQAGQQLAEARERAAKAETEVTFLRERLTELRNDAARPAPELLEPPDPPALQQLSTGPEKLWRYVYRGWRSRYRRS